MVWSDDGSVAVLYSQTGSWIQTFTGFPSFVEPGACDQHLSTGWFALGDCRRISTGKISPLGSLETTPEFTKSQTAKVLSPLLNIPNPVGLTFSADGGTLYALDGATNQVSEINSG